MYKRARTTLVREDDAEWKLIDVNAGSSDVTSAGDWQLLNGVGTGTDYQLRTGRKIKMRAIQLRGFTVRADSSGSGRWDLYVVLDKQANGSTPATTDFLETATSLSFLNLNNRDRFQVLYHQAGLQVLTNPDPASGLIDVYIPVDIDVVYNGTGGTAAAIASNSLWCFQVSDNGTAGQGFNFELYSRVRFTDA